MDKRKQLRVINDLLDQCGDCPKRGIGGSPDKICGHCALYHKIRVEGKKLWTQEPVHKPRKTIDLTVPEYWKLHNNGLPDEEIAFEKGISQSLIHTWKARNGIRTTRVQRSISLTVSEYKKLRADGWTVLAIRKKVGATESVFTRWRTENGLVDAAKETCTDAEILQAIVDGKPYWWIRENLHCGPNRIKRVKDRNGIAR